MMTRTSETPRIWQFNKTKSAVIASLIVLVAVIGGLLWMNHKTLRRLHRSAHIQFFDDAQRIAASITYFFSERIGDLQNLADSREFSIFFENQALGMSMTYGLQASLSAITEKMRSVVEGKNFNGKSIYRRIAFIAQDGSILADASAGIIGTTTFLEWGKFLQPEIRTPKILSIRIGQHHETMISLAYFHKERFSGQLIALFSRELLELHLLKPESEETPRHYDLEWVPENGNGEKGTYDSVLYGATVRSDAPEYVVQEGKQIYARIPVESTPFNFILSAPEEEVFGTRQPWHLTLALGLLCFLAAGSTAILWRFETRHMLLNTRLAETEKRELAIQKKNRQLEKEIDRRKTAEKGLKQYQENLENLVEKRTMALKSAQKEIVNKAIESGRAQLSAMVLHNIGNAVTPIAVLLDALRRTNDQQIVRYLEKVRSELLQGLSPSDAPGASRQRYDEVLAFFGQLIASLKSGNSDRQETENKIGKAVNYISEILTTQQNYAATEQEIKSVVDLNEIVSDGIRMQIVSLEKRQVKVIKKLDPGAPKVLIDKNRLMQLIVNIIKNGYEAIEQIEDESKSKVMTFQTMKKNGHVGFSIQDTGTGAETETIRRLFEFGHSGKGSSGFGLYYCKMFVEANQGNIEFVSPGPGKGATVKVWFNSA